MGWFRQSRVLHCTDSSRVEDAPSASGRYTGRYAGMIVLPLASLLCEMRQMAPGHLVVS